MFLDISSRFAEVEFDEARAASETAGANPYRYYSRPVELALWSIDEEQDMATKQSVFAWTVSRSAGVQT